MTVLVLDDKSTGRKTSTSGLCRHIERHGYLLFWLANGGCLAALHHLGRLSESAVVGLHLANVALLAALEFLTPCNRQWLLIQQGQVQWRLLTKTYLWYLFDSRVWFRAHGVVVAALGVWIARRLSLTPTELPPVFQFVGFALFIDFARYWIHRGQHGLTALWRWHTMHHTPTHLTPARAWWTHPVDDTIVYSLEVVLMVTLGLDPLVILTYVSIDNSFQLLNHANVRLRRGWLGVLFQHPRYHLVHHRQLEAGEATKNFGEMLTVWDRIFGTFETLPAAHMETLVIGIAPVKERSLWSQLTAPFYRPVDKL